MEEKFVSFPLLLRTRDECEKCWYLEGLQPWLEAAEEPWDEALNQPYFTASDQTFMSTPELQADL